MSQVAKMDAHLTGDPKMIHQKMRHPRMIDQKTDVPNYSDDQNFRDALPYAYSLISIEI